jgi:flagellar FliL protein
MQGGEEMSKKTLIFIAGGAFLFLAIVGGGFYMLWIQITKIQTMAPGAAQQEIVQPPKEKEKEKPVIGAVFPLDTFIVNLSDENFNHYLRITMHLELNDVKLTDELQKRLPQIRDIMFNILPVKKFKEIQGVEGKKALRDEIMASVNKLLVTGAVINIYFVEFVVQ